MKRINYVFLAVVFGIITAGSLVSCKDYEEDLRSELQGTKSILEALKGTIENADGIKNTLDNAVNVTIPALEKELEDANTEIATLQKTAATKQVVDSVGDELKKHIEAAKKELANLNATDSALAARILILEGKTYEACACATKVDSIITAVAQLTGRVGVLEDWKGEIATWQATINDKVNTTLPQSIKEALDSATAVATIAKINAATLEKHQAYLDSLADNDDALNARIDSLINEHNAAITAIDTEIDDIYSVIDTLTVQLEEKIGNMENLLNAIEEHVTELDDMVYDNFVRINTISNKVDDLDTKVATLLSDVTDIKNYLNQLITGVIIQATHNSIYGSFALPTNTQSNVLAAYYGKITTGLEFPSSMPAEYADPHSTILSDMDIAMLGVTPTQIRPNDVVVSDAEDNAGKLYLTINPANVDFTGVQFSLVNSLDEVSGVTLSAIKPSDKKLSFGWTRAVSNGFYEANARVSEEDVDKVKARINLNDLKDAVKDVLDRKNGINVTNVVSTVYNSFNDVLDANALKATWIDSLNKKEMAVYSQYAIAATAIEPLSYKFGQDFDFEGIPGFGRAENFLNRVFNKIDVTIKDAIPTFDLEKYKFTELKGVELKPDGQVIVGTTIEIELKIAEGEVFNGYKQEFEIKDKDGNIIDKISIDVPANSEYTNKIVKEIEIEITDDINEIFEGAQEDINGFISSINNDLQEINELMDELNKINEISDKLTDGLDRVESKLIEYLDKVNNKLTSWINSANKALQPTMLVATTEGYSRLSGVRKAPTVLKGNGLTLVPTSYTADILAPSYKRLVGVTNVWTADYSKNAQAGDATCENVLAKANQNAGLAEVQNGSKEVIKDITLEKGYVYEFAYTTVDYFGKVVAKKYYVTVK